MSRITLEKDNPFPGNLARPPALALAGDGRAVLALSITQAQPGDAGGAGAVAAALVSG